MSYFSTVNQKARLSSPTHEKHEYEPQQWSGTQQHGLPFHAPVYLHEPHLQGGHQMSVQPGVIHEQLSGQQLQADQPQQWSGTQIQQQCLPLSGSLMGQSQI